MRPLDVKWNSSIIELYDFSAVLVRCQYRSSKSTLPNMLNFSKDYTDLENTSLTLTAALYREENCAIEGHPITYNI
jgi:hypothetical protein